MVTDLVAIVLAGLSYGMILVLAAAGLSLIFGLMGILNFAHGALFALGAFLKYEYGLLSAKHGRVPLVGARPPVSPR